MIADTSFIIDLLKREESAVKTMKQLEKENKAYSLSTPTVYELMIGISRADIEEKKELTNIIESQTIYSLDKKASINAAQSQRKLVKNGKRIGHLDALISGIAQKNTGKILTNNTNEFKRIKDLQVKNYKS